MSFFEHEHVLNIGHRGASAAAPPNTLAAFEKAADYMPNRIDGTKKVKGVALGNMASKLAALKKKKQE